MLFTNVLRKRNFKLLNSNFYISRAATRAKLQIICDKLRNFAQKFSEYESKFSHKLCFRWKPQTRIKIPKQSLNCRYRAGGEVPEKVVEGDGGEDQPGPVQQGRGVEHQGQGEEDGRVPGI